VRHHGFLIIRRSNIESLFAENDPEKFIAAKKIRPQMFTAINDGTPFEQVRKSRQARRR